MAEWRECPRAGKELWGFDEPRESRQCLLGGFYQHADGKPCARFEAVPEGCACCPVPALVEAVEVARWYQIGSGPCHHEAEGGDAECESCKLWEKCEAALAAVKGQGK